MDILTQGLIGATLAQSSSRTTETRQATIIGLLSGVMADADILIRSSADPLLTLEFHRHFSHSIFFIPFAALLASLLLWPLFKKQLSFKRVFLFSLLGSSLSGFIDACTSYGTYLLWPIYNERIALNIISIIDPVFTLILLISIILVLRKQQKKIAHFALLLCATYLMLGWLQLQRAESMTVSLADSRGHRIEKMVVKPTLGNLILWRSIYLSGSVFYVDAIRPSITASSLIYPGTSTPQFLPANDLTDLAEDTTLYQDVLRFSKFSDNFISLHPESQDILGDVRYSMLPTSTLPLWGITLERDKPEQHASFNFYRKTDKTGRRQFIDMLMGRALQ